MKKLFSLLLGLCFLATVTHAQGGDEAMKAPGFSIQLFKMKKKVVAGTAVLFETTETVSSENATPGKRLRFRTTSPVEVDGKMVIPAGTMAFGTVEEVKSSTFNMPAYLTLRATEILTPCGEAVPVFGKTTLYAKYTDESLELEPGVNLIAHVEQDTKVVLP